MNVPERSSRTDIAKLISRCLANYGERKGVDMRFVTVEWHETLGAYSFDRLNAALSEHIRKSTWWPTIADFVAILREEAPGMRLHSDDRNQFCRDGRTEGEEIAFRSAQVLRWKQQWRAQAPEFTDPIDVRPVQKQASQEHSVGHALYHSCASRRARGEATCEAGCAKPGFGTRQCRMDKTE